MKCGGLVGESKMKILQLLPTHLVPITLLFDADVSFERVLEAMETNELSFPVIAKPDIGERGTLVEKINDEEQLHKYITKATYKFQVQEYLEGPVELGVFYYRFPNTERGVISSVVQKSMLNVTGNGVSTLGELILKNDRAKLQLDALEEKMDLNQVLPNGEKRELVAIGNHCKGTTFLNGESLITDKLLNVFDAVYDQMEGFHYGRFDVRCASIDELLQGKFKIMELNGAAAEPAHIYHPGFPLFKGIRTLMRHWRIMCEIGMANHKLGVPYLKGSIGWPMLGEHFKSDKYTSGQLA